MRLIIAGSRDFADAAFLNRKLDKLTARLDKKRLVVMSGHAKGADRLGEEWAFKNYVKVEVYHAEWDKHGKARAGPLRNSEMISSEPDALIAFHCGNSPGTADIIAKAEKAGLKVKVYKFDKAGKK